jgi:4'-phosphopantetheinyl transferase
VARPDRLDDVAPIPIKGGRVSPPEGVDLWCFFYGPHVPPGPMDELSRAYDALMTEDERVRHQRFYFERDQRLFLATRALVRCVLSHYASATPAAWRFERTEHGKPFVVAPGEAPTLHFNLTNTHGLVACAVSHRIERVGVDAENMTRTGETTAIADRFFSSSEVDALHGLPPSARRDRFFSYWTLKESYIKARGLGLAIPLGQFSFLLDDGDDIGIRFAPDLVDQPEPWRFRLFRASDIHMLAVGFADERGGQPPLRYARFVPLVGVEP